MSERRACRVTGTSRATHRYRSVADPQDELRLRVRELAATRVRYGYRRIHVLLRREGWKVNHKRVYRLYRDDGLAIRARTPRRRRARQYRAARPELAAPNQAWAMDFVSDTLAGGQRFRLLAVVDCFSRECLAIVPRVQFEQLVREHGTPQTIRCDNGPEFAGRVLQCIRSDCYRTSLQLHHQSVTQPRAPIAPGRAWTGCLAVRPVVPGDRATS